MLARLIRWCVVNPVLVGLAMAGLLLGGVLAAGRMPIDAIPDLSDVQVIVLTDVPGQSPRFVEDQVTYPLSTALLGVPSAEVVRGYSYFGLSFVYVIFEDGTDLYWARSRVLEALNSAQALLPPEITPRLGPDATGVGWVYEYALVDRSGEMGLTELRSLQDWLLRFELQTVPGVAEVASIGGHVRGYQVEVDPYALAAHGLDITDVRRAISRSNRDAGGQLIEMAETEFMVQGRGYLEGPDDLEWIAVGVGADGTPVLLRNVARISVGPELRRGLADLDGEGEVVAGIVVMRSGANARETIAAVKTKLAELQPSLPPGVEVVTVYDRAPLIERAVSSLRFTLLQQCAIVGLVCALFLRQLRSALVVLALLPMGLAFAFAVMLAQGATANIMSLAGIALAIGTMVDASIVMVENGHRRLAEAPEGSSRRETLIEAAVEVGPSLFFSLLIVTVAFLPIFGLQAEEGRLFRPLAYTKTWAMLGAALLSVTLVPVLMVWLLKAPASRGDRLATPAWQVKLLQPALGQAVRHRGWVLLAASIALVSMAVPMGRIGSEFMPPIDEGDLLYMPTTLPGVSIATAREMLQHTDRLIRTVPEVERVFGKVGRAETATDPAPLSMIETTVLLKPRSEWRPGLSRDDLVAELDALVRMPGLTNAWTMPIRTRLDMLASGVKTPVGVRVSGPDLEVLAAVAVDVEAALRDVPGTASAVAERPTSGRYIELDIDRERIARFGLTVDDVQEVIATAIGGARVTTAIEGLERIPVNLRYRRELRDDLTTIRRVLVSTPDGAHVPLEQLADIEVVDGPAAIKSENARPVAWVYVDLETDDLGGYVAAARRAVAERVEIPQGYTLHWSGRYEAMERAESTLRWIVPAALGLVFLLLQVHFGRWSHALLVMAIVPFGLIGGVWIIDLLGHPMSVAVAVGLLALAGLTAETAVLMLLFLDRAIGDLVQDSRASGEGIDAQRFWSAISLGASSRARPLLMTVASDALGLLPIMWATGAGAETMQRIAAPLMGGVFTATGATLIVLPLLYGLVQARSVIGAEGVDASASGVSKPAPH